MPERKTTRRFDSAKGVWTAWYNSNPKDTAVCELWRLYFVQPDQEEIPDGANKTAIKDIESRNTAAFDAAKKTAQTVYESQPETVKTTLGHGVGRFPGDTLNTSKKEADSEKMQDVRDDWVSLYSGKSRVRSSGTDPREAARMALATLAAVTNQIAVKASEKFAADSDAVASIAKARGETVAVFNAYLDAEADKLLGN